jgi:Flp pilus assembly protein TadD
MNKKIIIALLGFTLLTACGSADYANPDMPDDLKAFHEEQIELHQDVLDEDPTNKTSLFEIAYRYEQLGDYNKAISYYGEVLALDSDHQPALNNLAGIYEDMEEYTMAAQYIKELYLEKSASPEVIKDTVRILLLADEPENAYDAIVNFREETAEDEGSQELADLLRQDVNDYMDELNGIE